ncbi:hypothetical protein PIB30_027772 [Stylosanthes scabra]|uniref:Uncharacterized protein n=1 Tax=Stylosanthes scabra TaxID=79078 RepID=A0ABU6Z7K3_9FABA|nr:hypothetical protein [Stylosanthes scabra]
MEVEPKEGEQSKQKEEVQKSDEAISLAPLDLMVIGEGEGKTMVLGNKGGRNEEPKTVGVQGRRDLMDNIKERSTRNETWIIGRRRGLYFVELATEEEEANQNRTEMEWEKKLAMEISSKLHIKRRREEPTMLMIKERGEEEEEQTEETTRKRTRKEQGERSTNLALLEWKAEQDNNNDMAEEAGQYIPHHQP